MRVGIQTFTIRKAQKRNIEKSYLPLINLGILDYEVARIKFNKKNAEIIKKIIKKYNINIVSIQVKPKYVRAIIIDVNVRGYNVTLRFTHSVSVRP